MRYQDLPTRSPWVIIPKVVLRIKSMLIPWPTNILCKIMPSFNALTCHNFMTLLKLSLTKLNHQAIFQYNDI